MFDSMKIFYFSRVAKITLQKKIIELKSSQVSAGGFFMLKKFLSTAVIFLLIFLTGCGENKSEVVAQEVQTMQIKISVNGKIFEAVLENNSAAQEFYKVLPLEMTMNELNGNEKYFRLGKNLPSNDSRVGNIQTGDLMLWSSNTVVLFYKNFHSGYSYTRLGKIKNPEGLLDAVGNGNISVKFEK